MAYKIAFYDTKPYDERSFTEANEKFGFDIRYYKGHLNMNNVVLTKGVDVVCIFVNDTADAEVIRAMADNGVKLLALRCAGYNNVDLAATAGKMKVVRVPAYSPYAVAEFTVALMLSLNRKIPVLQCGHVTGISPCTGLWDLICMARLPELSVRVRLPRF